MDGVIDLGKLGCCCGLTNEQIVAKAISVSKDGATGPELVALAKIHMSRPQVYLLLSKMKQKRVAVERDGKWSLVAPLKGHIATVRKINKTSGQKVESVRIKTDSKSKAIPQGYEEVSVTVTDPETVAKIESGGASDYGFAFPKKTCLHGFITCNACGFQDGVHVKKAKAS